MLSDGAYRLAGLAAHDEELVPSQYHLQLPWLLPVGTADTIALRIYV